ncbi:probable galacturonosyltransferase 4 isoform X1 [Aegilops tauschii subsp. strangulata]|uniref:Hexosyltransferase n=5 Tax=Triticinae TaxID=1648030 RepID=A0A453RHT3_AEGTS|nr:probable galacturonosyltransferase 4 isoform X1 [Aegilops tauschii subsp. strangulata]XP_044439996.1 probable galacturonosyltransferase 4 [Triticum aestivum]
MAAARRWRRKCRTRNAVLALLIASVLAPLALYSGAPISPFSGPALTRGALGRDPSTLISRNEAGKRLNALPQDTFDPVPKAASDTRANNVGDQGTQLGQNGGVQQVVMGSNIEMSGESSGSKDGRVRNVEEAKVSSHDTSKRKRADGMVITSEEGAQLTKQSGLTNVGAAGDNEVRAMHNAGDLNAHLDKNDEKSSQQITDSTSKESGAMITSSNTSYSPTSSDKTILVLKDQLRRAKIYIGFLPSRGNHGFVKDLRRRMRDIQQALSGTTIDRQLPKNVHKKIRAMESILTKIKQVHDNCAAAIDKLQTNLHWTENQLEANKQEATYAAQVAAKALPKRLHCLALRLTNEYYTSSSNNKHFPYQDKLEDPKLHHYALFSDNVLAAAVVVNSTLIHAKKPADHVFHIVTDKLNYAAMRMWFLANPPVKAAIQVQKIEEFTWLNSSYSPVLKQLASQFMINYYFRTPQNKPDRNPKFRNPKYLSILNHLRFYLPEIFPKLNKVLFVDDDIVVQQDLSPLWSVDLKGRVNAAVKTCGEVFHRFDRYLNFSNPLIAKKFDRHACGWAYGMNMFDLSEWRRQNITAVYHYWQEQNEHRLLWKLGTLPAGLVTFWNNTFPLDRSWHLLGLGYKRNVNPMDIEQAAVIHYNGNLKPWLEVGLPKYRSYWSKYVNFDHAFIRECHIHP